MKFGIVGAFDRYNYGDILMPIVVQNQLINNFSNVKIDFYGLVKSDMEFCGGFKTKELADIYTQEYDAIILDGGDILSVTWSDMYLNLMKNKLGIFTFKVIRKISYNFSDYVAKMFLKGKTLRPWILDKELLKCNKLIYNTVDGSIKNVKNNKKLEELKRVIAKFDYISLRNEKIFKEISEINNNATMFPDSVLALDALISEAEINNNVSEKVKEISNNNYFVFQCKKIIGEKYYNEIISNIKQLSHKYNLKCLLLPIGYAQGHEDQVVLKKIHKEIEDETIMFDFNNVYEIMFLIKNSKFFIGTSLHGLITSIVYKVPHFAFTNEIKKQINFLETWNTTPIIYTDADKMLENASRIMDDYENVKKQVSNKQSELEKLVLNNFEKINELIGRENNE